MKKQNERLVTITPQINEGVTVVDEQKEILTAYPNKKSIAQVIPVTVAPLEKKLGWWAKRKYKKNPHQSYIVTMFFKNNTVGEYIITTNENRFVKGNKTYILRTEDARTNLSLKQNHYFYHEDYCMPLNRDIQGTGDKGWFSVTPSNLAPFIKMEVVKALVGSTDINKYLKMLVLICSVGTMATIAVLALAVNTLRKTGIK